MQRGQGLLEAFRNQAEEVRDSEMARTLKALENGADPTRALQKFGNALTNKLIHPTTAAIRNAAAEDRLDKLDFIQNTYNLQVSTAEDSQAHQAGPASNHEGNLSALTDSMMSKLESLRDRFEEVAALLSDVEIMADRQRFTTLSKEYAEIELS